MTPASSLYARLLRAALEEGMMRVLPFWADGGDTAESDATLAPRGHVLAAWPTEVVRARVEDLGAGGLVPFLARHLPPASDSTLPLVVALLSYDAGRAVPGHERLLPRPHRLRPHPHDALPDVLVARYDGYYEAPGAGGPWVAHGDTTRLDRALAGAPLVAAPTAIGELHDPLGPAPYLEGFAAIQAGIAAGDFYQVNLARRLEAALEEPPSPAGLASLALRLFGELRAVQPAAFSALLPIDDSAWLVSGTPECLLDWHAPSRTARSFPIKGTASRATGAADAAFAAALADSIKDQAEHVMIVDLVRNDLGHVAVPGSVTVPRLFAELPLRTLRHLVSEVRCEVAPGRALADLVGALFPGGSITGAPKIAAMRALDRWEPFQRGLYCGSLGVVRGGRDARFSILIRSAVLDAHGLTYATGGGIVADSAPQAELAETTLKAVAMRTALERAAPRSR